MLGVPMILKNPWTLNAFILVEDEVINIVEQHAQKSGTSLEAGGILLGYRRGKHLHITSATEPASNDKRSRFRFERDIEPHQGIARQHWLSSNQKIDYLGEWHTHPETNPSPSQLDMTEWRKVLESSRNIFAFLIVGSERKHWLGAGRQAVVRQAETV
jgi:integrative and conjugative element protein (TIGR02256 family)